MGRSVLLEVSIKVFVANGPHNSRLHAFLAQSLLHPLCQQPAASKHQLWGDTLQAACPGAGPAGHIIRLRRLQRDLAAHPVDRAWLPGCRLQLRPCCASETVLAPFDRAGVHLSYLITRLHSLDLLFVQSGTAAIACLPALLRNNVAHLLVDYCVQPVLTVSSRGCIVVQLSHVTFLHLAFNCSAMWRLGAAEESSGLYAAGGGSIFFVSYTLLFFVMSAAVRLILTPT